MPESSFEIPKSHIEPEKPTEDERKIKDELAQGIGKMYEQLRITGKNLREVIPQDRNFDIEIQESETGISLRLKHKDSKVEKDLGTYLPSEHSFEKDKIFVYKRREKKIGFSENEIEFRGFLISLFHEIGHSHEGRDHSITRWDDARALGSLLKKWVHYLVIAVKKRKTRKRFRI